MQFSPRWRSCEASASLFKCGKGLKRLFFLTAVHMRERSEKAVFFNRGAYVPVPEKIEKDRERFSPLWRSCEARASLFVFVNDLTKPFQPK